MSDDEKFTTAESGIITYSADEGQPFSISSGRYELNGVRMEAGKTYYLKNGDIVKNLDIKRQADEH